MSAATGTVGAVRSLLDQALVAYRGDATATAALHRQVARLDEPLRVAIAGQVKAGKSTLVNALVAEEIAPTDAGECTTVVTWYEHGATPRVRVHATSGDVEELPLLRDRGRLRLSLGRARPEDVERVVVDWPAARLSRTTLIDTPGVGSISRDVSARSLAFLTPQDVPSDADAVIYLMRHLHATDVRCLEAFRDTAVARSAVVNTVAVLSRADEIGAGRIDALISAGDVARRYRDDPVVRGLCRTVVPVAGLLAQSASTLRQAEFAALRDLARLPRADLARQLLSADRFRAGGDAGHVTTAVRSHLLDRFGLFGIRLGTTLVRAGTDEPTALARELVRRSGLDELRSLLAAQFTRRSDQLKARTALLAVEHLLRERPVDGAPDVATGLERVLAGAHDLRELATLTALRTTEHGLPPREVDGAERLLGAWGGHPHERLGVEEDAPVEELVALAAQALAHWRALAGSPLTGRATAGTCEVLVRTCEGLLADLAALPGALAPERA